MNVWKIGLITLAVALMGTAFVIGLKSGSRSGPVTQPITQDLLVSYIHGFQSQDFFDRAYEKAAQAEPLPDSTAILSAHHLLVASEMARVVESLKKNDGQTVIIISPNHFHRGVGRAQISFGSWSTPYGLVETDKTAVEQLLGSLPFLRSDESAFPDEHGVAALTTFIARSLPNSKVVSIVLEERLSADEAWLLGQTIAQKLPGAVLVSSVDMVHSAPESEVQKFDPLIISTLEAGCVKADCFADYPIDSNSSLRTLLSFANARGLDFELSYEGSSMRMGVAREIADNVSHILGVLYFK